AAEFLKENSYEILLRNFRGGRAGEIDIVALSPDRTIVFVEVKTRSVDGQEYGIPELGFEAVSKRKQRRIHAAAETYLLQLNQAFCRWRYDVIVVRIQKGYLSESLATSLPAKNNSFELSSIEDIEISHVIDAFT